MASTVINELITLITLKSNRQSESTLNNFRGGLRSIGKAGKLAAAQLIGVGGALSFLVTRTNKNIANQARFAKSIGISFESLQELQAAGKLVGATANDISQALQTLTDKMSSPRAGEYNRELLLLGVNVRNANKELKPANELFLDLSKAMRKLPPQQQSQLSRLLNLNQKSLRLLQQGPIAIKKAMIEAKAAGGVLPNSVQDEAIEYDRSITKLIITLRGLWQMLVINLTPTITRYIDKIEKAIISHKNLFPTISKAVIVIASLWAGFKVIISILSVFITVVRSVGLALGVVGDVLAVLNPEVAILGALLGGLILLWPKIVKWARKAGDAIKEFFSPAIDRAQKDIENIEKAFNKVKSFFTRGSKKAIGIGGIKTNTTQSIAVPKVSSGNNVANTNTNTSNAKTNNNVTINVLGNKDPAKVAQEVKNRFDLATAVQVASPGFNRPAVA